MRGLDIGLQGLVADKRIESNIQAQIIAQHQVTFLKQFPEIRTVFVADSGGRVTSAESIEGPQDLEALRKLDVSPRDYFAYHRDAKAADYSRLYVSRPFKAITGRQIVVISRAIHSVNGKFLGVVVGTLMPNFFDPVLKGILADGVVDAVAIHNRRGDILYRLPDPEKHIGKNVAAGPAFQHYLSSEGNLTRYLGTVVTDNTKRILVFGKIGDTGLDVGISARYEQAMAEWPRTVAWRILVFLLFVALTFALALELIRRQAAKAALNASYMNLENLVEERTAALSSQEKEFHLLAEAMPQIVWITLADGKNIYFNRQWTEYTGLALEESYGDGWNKPFHPDDKQRAWDAWQNAVKNNATYSLECRLRRADGIYRWWLIRGVPVLDENGQITKWFGTCTDIHDIKLSHDAAEAANIAKSTFLANMSHELRTPLNGMMGMTDLALRRATDAKQIDLLTKAGASARRLLGVINDILDISKIEAEKLTLEQHNFMLGEVMENLDSTIGQRVTDKHLRLCIELPPNSARFALRGDPLRLGQILLNFAANAVKFTEAGSITVRTKICAESPTNVRLRFEVQDTGIGISADDQKRLFNAFEQADGSMTRKYGGTGLGLAICKRLAQLMGGEVGVESQIGTGSTFWLSVRLDKAVPVNGAASPVPTVASDSAEAQLTARFAGTRILLAEDEPINREVSRLLLEDVGIALDLAEDGVEAVGMARRTRYALILMDMQMPNLNGIEATRAIRALPGYAHTPILAMTANAFNVDRQVCLDAGMNDHIAKPVDPNALFEALLKWLSANPD